MRAAAACILAPPRLPALPHDEPGHSQRSHWIGSPPVQQPIQSDVGKDEQGEPEARRGLERIRGERAAPEIGRRASLPGVRLGCGATVPSRSRWPAVELALAKVACPQLSRVSCCRSRGSMAEVRHAGPWTPPSLPEASPRARTCLAGQTRPSSIESSPTSWKRCLRSPPPHGLVEGRRPTPRPADPRRPSSTVSSRPSSRPSSSGSGGASVTCRASSSGSCGGSSNAASRSTGRSFHTAYHDRRRSPDRVTVTPRHHTLLGRSFPSIRSPSSRTFRPVRQSPEAQEQKRRRKRPATARTGRSSSRGSPRRRDQKRSEKPP